MKSLLATALFAVGAGGAWAQEPEFRSFLADVPAPADEDEISAGFTLGPRVGFIKTRGADDGTWLLGAQARFFMGKVLTIEGSIAFHQDDFEDGDVEVTTYPVEVTALIHLFPEVSLNPYLLGGVGWYYTRISFDGEEFQGEDDETESDLGFHLGFGASLFADESFSVNADVRYIFFDPDSEVDELDDEDFDSIQFTAGLNFKF